jgi:hypothetical protein
MGALALCGHAIDKAAPVAITREQNPIITSHTPFWVRMLFPATNAENVRIYATTNEISRRMTSSGVTSKRQIPSQNQALFCVAVCIKRLTDQMGLTRIAAWCNQCGTRTFPRSINIAAHE